MESIKKRHLTTREELLLNELISRSHIVLPSNWRTTLLASDLDDGGMGSLSLYPQEIVCQTRSLGSLVSDCQFRDIDGVSVIASLYLDKEGLLYELDMWKTDFSPLKVIPTEFQDV